MAVCLTVCEVYSRIDFFTLCILFVDDINVIVILDVIHLFSKSQILAV